MQSVPNLDHDSGRTALPMAWILLFYRDFGSVTVSIAIASHVNLRDLAM
jgi:hypothetical protein